MQDKRTLWYCKKYLVENRRYATVSKGTTLNDTGVTKQNIYDLVDLATVTAILNADIDSNAAIAGSKLGTLNTIAVGAGTIPVANIDTGTTANKIVKLDGSAKLPAVDGSQLTGLTASQIPTDIRIKGWVNFDGTAGISIKDSYNVSGVNRDDTGKYTISWDTDFANANYAVTCTGRRTVGDQNAFSYIIAQSAGSVSVGMMLTNGTIVDCDIICVMAIGAQ